MENIIEKGEWRNLRHLKEKLNKADDYPINLIN